MTKLKRVHNLDDYDEVIVLGGIMSYSTKDHYTFTLDQIVEYYGLSEDRLKSILFKLQDRKLIDIFIVGNTYTIKPLVRIEYNPSMTPYRIISNGYVVLDDLMKTMDEDVDEKTYKKNLDKFKEVVFKANAIKSELSTKQWNKLHAMSFALIDKFKKKFKYLDEKRLFDYTASIIKIKETLLS